MKPASKQEPWTLGVIRALRLNDADDRGLRALAADRWKWLLDATDREHITLALAVHCRDSFPAAARERLDATLERNALCHEKNLAACREIAEAFQSSGITYLVLKGVTQWPWYVDEPDHRSQSDVDIYVSPESLEAAEAVLRELGYECVHGLESRRADHLPVMIRRTGWRWRGDYYDPERPPSVELHFRFWDEATEGFTAGDAGAFLNGRIERPFGGFKLPALNRADGLSYSAMHLVRHLMRGDLQIRHVHEIAHFLERSAADDTFWEAWGARNSAHEIPVGAIAFLLAHMWFGCRLHRVPAGRIQQIPPSVARWFRLFALSPATAAVTPNKDELWLNLCLVDSFAARLRITARRLLPVRSQRVVLDPHVRGEAGLILSARRHSYEASFLVKRALHHVRTLAPVARSGFRWWKAGIARP